MAEGEKRKILVIDDQPDAVKFVRTVMEEAGHEVFAASSGNEGIEVALAQKPDLIILDVQMPGKDGFTTFVEMRAHPELESVPVVMLTGVAKRMGIRFSAEEMGDYLGREPEAYIEKPVDPAMLDETVRKLLQP